MKKIALSVFCSLIIAMGGFYFTVLKPALANVVCSLPFTLTNGTIADATQVMANYNAIITCLTNAAAAGANNDITSLSGLTTPLTPAQGGSNVYIGAAPTASGADLSIATTTPTNYSNTRGYTVIFTAVATNTSVQTLSVNAQTKKNIFKQSTAGPVPLSGGEIVPNQQYLATYDGTQFQINPVPSLAIGWGLTQNATQVSINTTNPPYGFDSCVNMTIAATVGSNLLGMQLFAADTGAAPTAIHPILCPFRDPTIASGDPTWKAITSAVYMDSNGAGASLGVQNGLPFRLWVVLYYNGGTPTLGLWQSTSLTGGASPTSYNISLNTMDEGNLQSPTAISGGATSAGTFYAPNGSSISSSPFRILGYMDWSNGLATAGNYASGPTKIQLFGPGIRKPGDRINYFIQTTTATSSTTNSYAAGAAPPTITSGATVVSITITPSAPMNVWRINANANVFSGSGGTYGTQFIRDGTKTIASAHLVIQTVNGTPAFNGPLQWSGIVTAASETLTQYYSAASGTAFLNSSSNTGAAAYQSSWMSAEEIQP